MSIHKAKLVGEALEARRNNKTTVTIRENFSIFCRNYVVRGTCKKGILILGNGSLLYCYLGIM